MYINTQLHETVPYSFENLHFSKHKVQTHEQSDFELQYIWLSVIHSPLTSCLLPTYCLV